jgi:VWFA-related protein
LLVATLFVTVATGSTYLWLQSSYQTAAAEYVANPTTLTRAKAHAFDGYPTPTFTKPLTEAADKRNAEHWSSLELIDRYQTELAQEKQRAEEAFTKLVARLQFAIDHNIDASATLLSEALPFVSDPVVTAQWEESLKKFLGQSVIPPGAQLSHIATNSEGHLAVVACQGSNGEFIRGLSNSDFQLLDSQQRLWPHFTVCEEPGHLVDGSVLLLVDSSTSMQGERIAQLKTGLKNVLDQVPPSTRLRLVTFNHEVHSLTDFTKDRHIVAEAIDELSVDGATAIAEAIQFSLQEFQSIEGPKSIVLCTDGQDEKLQQNLPQILSLCQSANVFISVLAIDDPTLDRETLQNLSDATGGVLAYATKPSEIVKQLTSLMKAAEPSYRIRIFPGNHSLADFSIQLRGSTALTRITQ